jgi:hypothetical protein
MNEKTYTIECPNCGIVKNNSPLYCDYCGNPIERIKIGYFWYDAVELDKDNPYYQGGEEL